MGYKTALRTMSVLPLLLAYRLTSRRSHVDRDIRRMIQPRLDLPLPATHSLADAVSALRQPEYRSVFYERLRSGGGSARPLGAVLRRIYPGQVALFIGCGDIGPGLYMSHGFATIVLARRIGPDCLISQQVTIGYSDKGGPPTLGARVRIGAGAMVLGPVTVGDDAVVGANAVVVSDVAPATVVAGIPARILQNAEDRFSALRSAGHGGGQVSPG